MQLIKSPFTKKAFISEVYPKKRYDSYFLNGSEWYNNGSEWYNTPNWQTGLPWRPLSADRFQIDDGKFLLIPT